MSFDIAAIHSGNDLIAICTQMTPENWAADNEMTNYQPEALKTFLKDPKNILLLAYDNEKIAGAALAYEILHPEGENYFYVHELDTHPKYRRQGVGTMLMKELLRMAKDRGCYELWLGTEEDSLGAQALYESLGPSEVDKTVTYTYKL